MVKLTVALLLLVKVTVPVAVVPAKVLVGKAIVVEMSSAPTGMKSVLVLFVVVISGVLVATVAVPVMVLPVAVPGTNTSIVVTVALPALPLALNVPKLTVTTWPVLSVTVVTTLLAVPAPRLVTLTVALTVVFGCALAGRSKVTETSGISGVMVALTVLLLVVLSGMELPEAPAVTTTGVVPTGTLMATVVELLGLSVMVVTVVSVPTVMVAVKLTVLPPLLV